MTGGLQGAGQGPTWRGAELLSRSDWELTVSPDEWRELACALEATSELELEDIDAARFELPHLGPRLRGLRDSLEHGSGAARLRGLDLDALGALPLDDAERRLFWGIARHVGTPVSQSATGDRLLEVRDASHKDGDPRVRGPNTNRRLSFHTDRCDVIAFLCVRPAERGGETHLVSSRVLRDELARRHPDVLRVLEGPYPYLRHTVDQGNALPYVELPVFSEHEGHFAASFLRVLIDRAHRDPQAPDLTAEQVAALDKLEEVAEDEDLYARLTLERGDALFLNNWVTFHRRTAFEDAAEPDARRLLLRLWLAVPNSRPLHDSFADHFGSTQAGAIRGGMRPLPDRNAGA